MCHQNEFRCLKCVPDLFFYVTWNFNTLQPFSCFPVLPGICWCIFNLFLYLYSFRGRIYCIGIFTYILLLPTTGTCGGWHFVDNINTICNCSVWWIIAVLGNFVYVVRKITFAGREEYLGHFMKSKNFGTNEKWLFLNSL